MPLNGTLKRLKWQILCYGALFIFLTPAPPTHTHPHTPSGCWVENSVQEERGFWAQAGAGPGQWCGDGRGEPQ